MQQIDLKVGDTCWIHGVGSSGNFTKGTVISIVNLPNYGFQHYIIEIPTHIDPILEIRDPFTVSDHPDKPIGCFRRSEETLKAIAELREQIKAGARMRSKGED
jgi:hypothetical protein